jgi:hypothetical protein
MKNSNSEPVFKVRPRPSESVSIKIPIDTLESLQSIAQSRDMSLEALLRFYIGQGLRQDLAARFAERLFDTTAEVLSQHIESEEERSRILEEIQAKSSQNF